LRATSHRDGQSRIASAKVGSSIDQRPAVCHRDLLAPPTPGIYRFFDRQSVGRHMPPQPIDSRFPAAVQELWAELSTEVTWIHGRWIIYRQLFGTNKERVDLLNESAGTASWILQDLLLNDVQLSISKLSDPAGDVNRRNRLALRWGGRPSEQFRASSDEV